VNPTITYQILVPNDDVSDQAAKMARSMTLMA